MNVTTVCESHTTIMRVYTTAPKAYDYPYMNEVGQTEMYLDRPVRILETDDEFRCKNFQIPRYMSGMHLAMTQEEWDNYHE